MAVVLLLFAGFVALGVWQLERRTWKLALIERVDQRVHAAPTEAPARDRWPKINVRDDEYLHVRATGRFLADRATLVQAVTEYGRGYWLMVPLRTLRGDVVLVNRGFVTTADRSDPHMAVTADPVVVVGLLRLTEPGGSFLHDNDPAHDRWYSRDVAAIARVRGLPPVAPYFIDADALGTDSRGFTSSGTGSSGTGSIDTASIDTPAAVTGKPTSGGGPIGGLTVIAFRNDHLLYAITWFVLAALCAWAVRLLLRRDGRARKEREPGDDAAP